MRVSLPAIFIALKFLHKASLSISFAKNLFVLTRKYFVTKYDNDMFLK